MRVGDSPVSIFPLYPVEELHSALVSSDRIPSFLPSRVSVVYPDIISLSAGIEDIRVEGELARVSFVVVLSDYRPWTVWN